MYNNKIDIEQIKIYVNKNEIFFWKYKYDVNFFNIYLFIYLFHTPICHQLRIGLCGELRNIISKKKNPKGSKKLRNEKFHQLFNFIEHQFDVYSPPR